MCNKPLPKRPLMERENEQEGPVVLERCTNINKSFVGESHVLGIARRRSSVDLRVPLPDTEPWQHLSSAFLWICATATRPCLGLKHAFTAGWLKPSPERVEYVWIATLGCGVCGCTHVGMLSLSPLNSLKGEIAIVTSLRLELWVLDGGWFCDGVLSSRLWAFLAGRWCHRLPGKAPSGGNQDLHSQNAAGRGWKSCIDFARIWGDGMCVLNINSKISLNDWLSIELEDRTYLTCFGCLPKVAKRRAWNFDWRRGGTSAGGNATHHTGAGTDGLHK